MDSDEVPHLSLVVYHPAMDSNPEGMLTVWNPEDDLFGHLELSSTKDLSIHRITVYFEGERGAREGILLIDTEKLPRCFTQLDNQGASTP